ncbi:MAG: 1-(5-phosphoribosyl)-5-[(5-phosphoribosylamino)methylideneamino]imidazole-4-carboxamide isomerase [Flavobacteria bacterium RIFCSPLOWO2_12_FULL_31_7]|nr:MAG: 1-(5-phosphoribosyl)-5-[(5-phosphoribosylamino)methylideneamino]imidazole-4-carboxamide isomerase [Flavobacteria bacterium RIFCSPLOWO2_12_FULL_31_7]
MRIIPAIDIIDGKCVRLSKGNFKTKIIYNDNPLEVAKSFEDHGIENLHLIDLDGAKTGKIVNHKVLETIATQTNLKIDFGGGIKTSGDVKIAFESGANQITGGSVAVNDAEKFLKWIERFGPEKMILGADFNPYQTGAKIAISGWKKESTEDLLPFIYNYLQNKISYVVCTDISKDGMLSGPSFEIYKQILAHCNTEENTNHIKLIASGGISEFDEIPKLADLGCEGVIIGKAIYEDRISLKQLENYIIK